jgi:hypothetical protein
MKTTLLTLTILAASTTAFAQGPSHSKGTQSIRISYDECLRRAENALTSENYRIDDRDGAWRGGSKGGVRAEIICAQAQGNTTAAHIIVVGGAFGGGLDSERTQLQQRMDPSASNTSGGGPVSATSSNLVGRWNWVATCQSSTPSGRFEIANHRQASFAGSFSNANAADTGTIDGTQQGLLVEFRRQIPNVGEQRWKGGVERAGSALRMEGRIDGPGGPCTFTATSASNGTPRNSNGAITQVTGTWTWTAACNGSRPSGQFQISNQRRDGSISGVFSNANPGDTGTIDGRQQGLLIDFRRSIPGAGEQMWIGGLATSGGTLSMEGRIEGAGGPCNFSATLVR